MMRRAIFAVGILAITTGVWSEKKPPPVGILAASAGESVVLADPLNRWSKSFDIGTVGWLFQAPGGVLFAPDLVRGKTTVLDLRGRRIVDHIEGVTMPHFGPSPDRYFVAAGDILVVSYPDRAIISRIAAEIGHPRQVIPASDTVVLVLEWSPDGSPKSILSAIDLPSRQVVFRRPLAGDVRSCSLSSQMGLVALADAEANAIHLVEPATHRLVAQLSVNGSPRDVAFLPDGHTLVAASAAAEGVGEARMWSLKAKRHNLKVRKERQVPLAGTPLQLAVSPTGLRRAAIGLEAARIDVVDFAEKAVIVSIDLPAPPRDVVWCDEHRPGPIMPEWTDTTPPELTLDSAGQ